MSVVAVALRALTGSIYDQGEVAGIGISLHISLTLGIGVAQKVVRTDDAYQWRRRLEEGSVQIINILFVVGKGLDALRIDDSLVLVLRTISEDPVRKGRNV